MAPLGKPKLVSKEMHLCTVLTAVPRPPVRVGSRTLRAKSLPGDPRGHTAWAFMRSEAL